MSYLTEEQKKRLEKIRKEIATLEADYAAITEKDPVN